MNRTTIWALILSLALASAAVAAPTPEDRCEAAKLNALRKRTFCIEGERRKEVLGTTPDTARCEETFRKSITMADEAAAKKGASCRWLDNADGTATDLNSGLQWELKTDDGSVHDEHDTYRWSTTFGVTTPNGTVFTAFLGTLNGGVSGDGHTTAGCFASHCDWRLPTIEELRGILEAESPNCTMSPCTTIPGFTASNPGVTSASWYWSSSTHSPGLSDSAWYADFDVGFVGFVGKAIDIHARAVRAGSRA